MKLRNMILMILSCLYITVCIVGCDKTVSNTKQEPGEGGKGLSAQEKAEKQGK